jgi:cyclic beta-1,2-glucan synthetase
VTVAEVLSDHEASTPPERSSLRCPGLLSHERWDDASALRGEIHSAERLVEHAVDVARAHRTPSTRITPGPLRARLSAARSRIREAYAALSRDLRDGQREPLPAEEWLLDNSHVVEDQLREIHEDLPWGYLIQLPRIAGGVMRGYPRVYGLTIDYLRHTDARIDLATLSSYVDSYQRVAPLTIGELWAIPIMLRIGLILTVGALVVPSAESAERARADAWGKRILREGTHVRRSAALLADLQADGKPTAAFLVQLLRALRDHEGIVSDWIRTEAAKLGAAPEELARREHLRQAADQVSVGNAITSMRSIGAIDWNVFFARVSAVEAVLTEDPAGVYDQMDDRTRDRYRHAVEDLARRSSADETTVARAALLRARAAPEGVARHIGHHLIDAGRAELERELRYRPRLGVRAIRLLERHATLAYLTGIFVLTTAGCAGAAWAGRQLVSPALTAVLVLAFVFPASEMAIAVVNALVVAVLPPRLLPKLALDDGIPAEARTLVVVPALLDGEETIERLVRDLEIRALANPDPNLYFALLTDFTDAPTPDVESDAALLAHAQKLIDALAAEYQHGTAPRFALLHRARRWNETQRLYLGWERKRGKLAELNRLLRGDDDGTFVHVGFDRALLRSFRYVITLDADTELPRGAARRLVATLFHPLNRPVVDARRRVVRGHAILQPRVGTIPTSGRRSRWARISAGPAGLDPYTTAVSDLYQDLFGEGSFVGKGIYDVDAFTQALEGRVPEDRLLSHDLLEGILARSALVTDVEVLDEQPASYEVAAGRAHRWIRGDWQLLPWLLGVVPDVPLRVRDRWKIVDNMRRSLVPIALVLLCFGGWLSHPTVAAWVSITIALLFVVPVAARLGLTFARSRSEAQPWLVGAVSDEIVNSARQALTNAVFLLDGALVSADAIARTLHRLVVSKRNLLEWRTTSASERVQRGLGSRGVLGVAIAATVLVVVAWRTPVSLSVAAPVLLAWIAAPAAAAWLRKAPADSTAGVALDDVDRHELRLIARKTWLFFETFVTAAENHLPPDNFQEDPRGVVAHRTSPTNIGLYLMAVVAARDFGFITSLDLRARLSATLATIARLERRNGHVLNWYDTQSLAPLAPQYVSTVDSGNLAAYLWTVRRACMELGHASLIDAATFRGVEDALRLAGADEAATKAAALAAACPTTIADAVRALDELGAELARIDRRADRIALPWLARAEKAVADAAAAARASAPFLALRDLPPSLAPLRAELEGATSLEGLVRAAAIVLDALDAPSLGAGERARAAELRAAAASTAKAARAALADLAAIAERAGALADAMDFRFLLDPERDLFSIGYNASNARLDPSHYDLLASEARLATFVAIAKGDAPQDAWFRMGRPLASTTDGERVLVSWSGSMFEYLMPLLVTRAFPETLLTQTYDAMLARQREYGRELGIPWGVSESAYNLLDLGLTYQYRSFGVPGLGLKNGLAEDRVVAPYATGLAALVRPDLAARNFRTLEREGAGGTYGFYEAIDYTEAHLPPGRRNVVVKTFMAHHQGMVLVALGEALNGSPMRRRFHSDPRVVATELLLEERIPVRVPLVDVRKSVMPSPSGAETELDGVEHVGLGSSISTRAHLLGHGELSILLTVAGDGFTTWKGMDVFRFREDAAGACGGTWIYLRDAATDRVWSVGHQPTRAEPDFYGVAFSIDRVELRRRDGAVETVTEVVASPEHPVELRRITLTNHGDEPRELDLTTYGEVVLMPRSADVAHRVFTSFFVEIEAITARCAMLARRRPRGAHEPETWVAQMLVAEEGDWEAFSYEGSRARFVGRGRDGSRPQALDPGASLSGTTGTTLDPVLALRRGIVLPPGGRARLTLVTMLGATRSDVLDLLETYATHGAIPRTFELAWADARVELKHLGIGAAQAHRFQRLGSGLSFPHRALRDDVPLPHRSRGRSALWSQGISGDLPVILVRLDDSDFGELVSEVLLAHEYFRLNGMASDLVLLNEEPAGYMQPLHESVLALLRGAGAEPKLDQRGGVFLRRAHDLNDDDRAVLRGFARVVLRASRGSLARQLRVLDGSEPLPARARSTPRAAPTRVRTEVLPLPGLSADGSAYVIPVDADTRPPAPWCNVLANPRFGTLVSESGGGYTWAGNSQRHRLTPWSNDPIVDPVGEILLLRDEAGTLFSLTPAPAGAGGTYTVRHTPTETTFEHVRGDLAISLQISVAERDPVKMFRVHIENRGRRARELTLVGVFEWVLSENRESSRTTVATEWDAELHALLAWNPLSAFPEDHAFVVATAPVRSVSGDRTEIFGAGRELSSQLGARELSGRTGSFLDPCAALDVPLTVAAGAHVDLALVLGNGGDREEARALARKYATYPAVKTGTDEAARAHRSMLDRVTVATPVPELDAMMNHWLLHQVVSCRLFGRTGFYQSGGAFGYRDQLQDVLALLHARPDLAREHVLRAAARQFVEGDVQHWWHPETGQGVRTHYSDDMLWLPFVVATYVRVTGDAAVLDQDVPFLTGPLLGAADDDVFSAPSVAAESASLWEHCCRALDVATTAGANGLPLMRGGDWNDGMNRVGREGRGESVWLAWFLGSVAREVGALARDRGDLERAERCHELVARLAQAIDAHAWDGEWYRRATFDDGSPLGSAANEECRIDAIAQSWAAIAGFGDPTRARTAVMASLRELVREEPGVMPLLWPPFARRGHDPGYIASYPAGIRENAGQYNHGISWTVQALARLGEGDRAVALLRLLVPLRHRERAEIERYVIEPYVFAGDVYCGSGFDGRGGWSWYTGAAGWIYRIVLEDVLGIRRRGAELHVVPCIARAWSSYSVEYRYGTSSVRLTVENPEGLETGAVALVIDGSPVAGDRVPLVDDGRRHDVRVTLRRHG